MRWTQNCRAPAHDEADDESDGEPQPNVGDDVPHILVPFLFNNREFDPAVLGPALRCLV